jgi:hypothetical protein
VFVAVVAATPPHSAASSKRRVVRSSSTSCTGATGLDRGNRLYDLLQRAELGIAAVAEGSASCGS